MRKLVIGLISLLVVFIIIDTQTLASAREREKATVSIIFLNNAKTTYDDELTKKLSDWLYGKVSGIYNVLPSDSYIQKLNQAGFTDLASVEKSDIANVFNGSSVDYVIYAELHPFIRKEKITFFTYGKDMTSIMTLKIIDVPNCKSLFNGKLSIKASDSTTEWIIGNKSVAFMAIDKMLIEAGEVISYRLPLKPPNRSTSTL